ncbi:uncharacterized protein LOC124122581 [Haliotis rufescens]|uniref:uncharacterized protein LOC124122581 n=1 Tax=Haliotis rufescens TaxID=6454 RepID=UPI00201F4EBF|nr:uncharacterized protein LOC124122581 [Haliotis rufescens]
MSGSNATAAVHVGVTSTLLENTSAATQSIINPTTTQNIVNTTTTSPGFFDQKILSEAWDANKTTVAWLVPVIVVVVGILVLVALALVYVIRGFELWVLKCCHKVCGCCEAPARRLDNEYTHLTESMHDNDAVNMTEFERGSGSSAAYRGLSSDKQD